MKRYLLLFTAYQYIIYLYTGTYENSICIFLKTSYLQ